MKGSSLAQLQAQFKTLVLQGEGQLLENDLDIFCESRDFTRRQRMAVYQYAVKARIKEAVAEDFPRTQELIGDEKFDKILESYLILYPSHYASLAEVSKNFPAYLEKVVLAGYPYLAELARYEWEVILAQYLDGASVECTSIADLSSEQIPHAILLLNPSIRHFRSAWSVQNKEIRLVPTNLIIYVDEGRLKERILLRVEDVLLEQVRRGVSIGELSLPTDLSKKYHDKISDIFAQFVQDKVILGVQKG